MMGLATLIASALTADNLFWWFLPIAGPQILAPFIITFSSTRPSGRASALAGLFWVPMEVEIPAISTSQIGILKDWRRIEAENAPLPPDDDGPAAPQALQSPA